MKQETQNAIAMTGAIAVATALLYVLIFFLAGCTEEFVSNSESIECKFTTYCPETIEQDEYGYYKAYSCVWDTTEMETILLNSPCKYNGDPCGDGTMTCYTDDACYGDPCQLYDEKCSPGGQEMLCLEDGLCNYPYWAYTGRNCW